MVEITKIVSGERGIVDELLRVYKLFRQASQEAAGVAQDNANEWFGYKKETKEKKVSTWAGLSSRTETEISFILTQPFNSIIFEDRVPKVSFRGECNYAKEIRKVLEESLGAAHGLFSKTKWGTVSGASSSMLFYVEIMEFIKSLAQNITHDPNGRDLLFYTMKRLVERQTYLENVRNIEGLSWKTKQTSALNELIRNFPALKENIYHYYLNVLMSAISEEMNRYFPSISSSSNAKSIVDERVNNLVDQLLRSNDALHVDFTNIDRILSLCKTPADFRKLLYSQCAYRIIKEYLINWRDTQGEDFPTRTLYELIQGLVDALSRISKVISCGGIIAISTKLKDLLEEMLDIRLGQSFQEDFDPSILALQPNQNQINLYSAEVIDEIKRAILSFKMKRGILDLLSPTGVNFSTLEPKHFKCVFNELFRSMLNFFEVSQYCTFHELILLFSKIFSYLEIKKEENAKYLLEKHIKFLENFLEIFIPLLDKLKQLRGSEYKLLKDSISANCKEHFNVTLPGQLSLKNIQALILDVEQSTNCERFSQDVFSIIKESWKELLDSSKRAPIQNDNAVELWIYYYLLQMVIYYRNENTKGLDISAPKFEILLKADRFLVSLYTSSNGLNVSTCLLSLNFNKAIRAELDTIEQAQHNRSNFIQLWKRHLGNCVNFFDDIFAFTYSYLAVVNQRRFISFFELPEKMNVEQETTRFLEEILNKKLNTPGQVLIQQDLDIINWFSCFASCEARKKNYTYVDHVPPIVSLSKKLEEFYANCISEKTSLGSLLEKIHEAQPLVYFIQDRLPQDNLIESLKGGFDLLLIYHELMRCIGCVYSLVNDELYAKIIESLRKIVKEKSQDEAVGLKDSFFVPCFAKKTAIDKHYKRLCNDYRTVFEQLPLSMFTSRSLLTMGNSSSSYNGVNRTPTRSRALTFVEPTFTPRVEDVTMQDHMDLGSSASSSLSSLPSSAREAQPASRSAGDSPVASLAENQHTLYSHATATAQPGEQPSARKRKGTKRKSEEDNSSNKRAKEDDDSSSRRRSKRG